MTPTWELHTLPSDTTGSTRGIWTIQTCTALESPRYGFVGIQTDKANNTWQDPTTFEHVNILNNRSTLNADYWPNERMTLNFDDEYAETYKAYSEYFI